MKAYYKVEKYNRDPAIIKEVTPDTFTITRNGKTVAYKMVVTKSFPKKGDR